MQSELSLLSCKLSKPLGRHLPWSARQKIAVLSMFVCDSAMAQNEYPMLFRRTLSTFSIMPSTHLFMPGMTLFDVAMLRA